MTQDVVRGVAATTVAAALMVGVALPSAMAQEMKGPHARPSAPSASPKTDDAVRTQVQGDAKSKDTQIQGRVESKKNGELVVRTKDGRRVTVNVAQIDQTVLNQIQTNQDLTITGNLKGDQIVAQSVNISDVSASGQVAAGQTGGTQVRGDAAGGPSKPGKAEGHQRLRGRVVSKDDRQAVVKTDDGRRVTVNLTQIEQTIVNHIQVNQELTITGDVKGDQIIAQSVDISGVSATGQVGVGQTGGTEAKNGKQAVGPGAKNGAPAASPGTPSQPTSRDDCKDGGWRHFGDPSFKNQGECVSWVNRQERDARK